MQDIHDERRIALDPEPLLPREGYFFRLMSRLGLREKNIRDEKVAKAAEANRDSHEAEAHRILRQPGVSDAAVEKALRVLGKVGRGEGFADLALLPAIALACAAIVRALAVLS